MDAYIYQAAVYCEDCAEKIKANLSTMRGCARNVEHEEDYDSDEWPKLSYMDGGGEADSPQHCDSCQCFLENPLTAEGLEYVYSEILEAAYHRKRAGQACISTWIEFYGLDLRGLLEHAGLKLED